MPDDLNFYIYGQDGLLVPMKCEDTPHNRRFVEWLRQFDRYTPTGEWFWKRHVRRFKNWRIRRRYG